MSSSASGSGRDGEDPSVNQDGGGNFDFSTNNGIELDSISLNADPTYGFAYQNPSAPQGNPEIVVLSDSEEDDDPLISSGTIYKNSRTDASGVNFSVPPPGISVSYADDATLGAGGTSCLGLFNANDDEYGMPLWPLPPGTQTCPGFQLFSSDAEVLDALVDMQHNPMNCPTSMNGYTLAADNALGSIALVPDRSDPDMNDGLVDYPLAFGGEDPSLQILLPTRPSDSSVQFERSG